MRTICFCSTMALLLTACPEAPRVAKTIYRVPFENGTQVQITTDFWSHSTPPDGMVDMVAVGGPGRLAAAARGWVRQIEDSHNVPINGDFNNYIWIEHPEPYCQDPNDSSRADWPGKPSNYHLTCTPCEAAFCNEVTVYAHQEQFSTTGCNGPDQACLSEGDWVEAGQFLGIESDIGFAPGGRHLHWHVAVVNPDQTPNNGYYPDWTGMGWIKSPQLFPLMCRQGAQEGDDVDDSDAPYVAIDCGGAPGGGIATEVATGR
ncbi:MAG: M23 family metallopeptidase [Myxococcales bacterium]|nr:M23 family metallopeptidase [Myxococcales bacterium]